MNDLPTPVFDYQAVLFVQLNDLYHIDACADYRDPQTMLLPRVATVIDRLRKKYDSESVIVCLPGDFLAPSALSRAHAGQQMVDVLNELGVNFVCPGNHEFDLKREDMSARDLVAECIAKSKFRWLLTNLKDGSAKDDSRLPFDKYAIIDLSPSTKLILVGMLLPMELPNGAGKTAIPAAALTKQMDAIIQDIGKRGVVGDPLHLVVALTHLELKADRHFAASSNLVHMIMGGHDHNVKVLKIGSECLITKTASNARTLRLNFVVEFTPADSEWGQSISDHAKHEILRHSLSQILTDVRGVALDTDSSEAADECTVKEEWITTYDMSAAQPVLFSSLALNTCSQSFQDLVPPAPDLQKRIMEWVARKPELNRVVGTAPIRLELDDAKIRTRPTNFALMCCEIMRGTFSERPLADVALITGGTFRLDRDIEEGETLTCRLLEDIFYYDNKLFEYEVSGSVLLKILDQSQKFVPAGVETEESEGSGEFLQMSGFWVTNSTSGGPRLPLDVTLVDLVRNVLDPGTVYRVVVTNYVSEDSEAYKHFFADLKPQEVVENLRVEVQNSLDAAMNWVAQLPDVANRMSRE